MKLLVGATALLVLLRPTFADYSDVAASSLWTTAVACCALLLIRRLPTPSAAPPIWCLLGLVGLCLSSFFWSADPGATLYASGQVAAIALLAVLLWQVAQRHPLELSLALLLGTAVAAAVGIKQVLYGYPIAQDMLQQGMVHEKYIQTAIGSGRAFGTFLAPDMLGGALGPAVLLALGVGFSQRKVLRWCGFGLALLLLVALLLTKSAGAAAAFAVAGAVLVAVLIIRSHLRHKKIWLVLGLIATLVVASGIALQRFDGIATRVTERLNNQSTGFRALALSPVVGNGHNSFAVIAPAIRQDREPLTRYAHGVLGQTACDLGVLGLLLLLATALFLGHQVYWTLTRPKADILRCAAACALLCAALHGLVDYDLMFAENQLYLWVAAAICAPPPRREFPKLSYLALAPLCLMTLFIGGWRASLETNLLLARQEPDCQQRNTDIAALLQWAPPVPQQHRQLAQAALRCPDLGEQRRQLAAEQFELAHQTSPRDAILHAEYALSLAALGQFTTARQEADSALQTWPRVGRIHAYRGMVEVRAGELQQARAWLKSGEALDSHDTVVVTLKNFLQVQGEQ